MTFDSALGALEAGVLELSGVDVAAVSGVDAASWLSRIAVIERQLCAVRLALSARAVAGNAHIVAGARDGASWLASTTGVSVGAARQSLATASQLSSLDQVRDAFSAGVLSLEQVAHVAEAAVVDPSRQSALIDVASKSPLVGLKRTCREVVARQASADEETERWERLKTRRYIRTWSDTDGMLCGQFRLLPDDGAKFLAKAKPFVNASFKAARAEGRREPHDRYAADGFCAMVDAAGGEAKPIKAEVVVVANYDALIRGWATDGERCEIEGVGPIPVALARSLANDCYLSQIVLNKGRPAMATGKGHYIPNRLRVAVKLRDRCCVVPECGSTFRLEVDHIIPVVKQGPTKLENLRLLCKAHHDLRTYRGFDIVTDSDGERRWVQARPPSPNQWKKAANAN